MSFEEKYKKLQRKYAQLKRRTKIEMKKLNIARTKAFHRGQSYMREKISQQIPEAMDIHLDFIEPISFSKSKRKLEEIK